MNSRTRFTRWYVRRGYKFGYRKDLTAYYVCPAWVKIFVPFLFSPSVYATEAWYKEFAKAFAEGLAKGMKKAIEEKEKAGEVGK